MTYGQRCQYRTQYQPRLWDAMLSPAHMQERNRLIVFLFFGANEGLLSLASKTVSVVLTSLHGNEWSLIPRHLLSLGDGAPPASGLAEVGRSNCHRKLLCQLRGWRVIARLPLSNARRTYPNVRWHAARVPFPHDALIEENARKWGRCQRVSGCKKKAQHP